jgi:hypothetical protein
MVKVTAQVSDSVCYQGNWYALAGNAPRRGGPLFHPSHYGLRVSKITTACHRGYVCRYEVNDGRLELVSVDLGLGNPPAELFGAPVSQGPFGSVRYEPIRVPQPFNGTMLIASEFLPAFYEHMGYHEAWKYQHVFALNFIDGHLHSAHDHSLDAAARRAAVSFGDRVDPCFDRHYRPGSG